MGNQRFSITASKAVGDQELPDGVYRTLSTLGLFGDKNGWCFPSLATIAEIRGISKAAVSQHIKLLVQKGYVNSIPRYDKSSGAQRSNMYQLKFDFEFENKTPLSPGLNTPLSPELNPPLSPGLNLNNPSNVSVKRNKDLKPTASRLSPIPNLERNFKSKHEGKKQFERNKKYLIHRIPGDEDYSDPRLYHPAMRIYRSILKINITPKGNWRDKIINLVGENGRRLALWEQTCNTWAGVSANPYNIQRMVSIFENGGVLNTAEEFDEERRLATQDEETTVDNPLSAKSILADMEKWNKSNVKDRQKLPLNELRR